MNQPTDPSAEPAAQAAGRKFPCPSCGAPEMAWDAGAQALKCPYCGHVHQIAAQEGTQGIVEHDLQAGLTMATQRGFGATTRTVSCKTCGATVAFGGQSISTRCDFCGSPHVLEQESNRNLIRPESMLPFSIDKARAQSMFSEWIGGLWFRPGDLKHKASVGEINGVYIPYWTFDAWVASSWTAQAGTDYQEQEAYWGKDANGNNVQMMRTVTKTHWRPAWGSRQDHHDDVLVCAGRGLPESLVQSLRGFELGQLRPYDPGFLSGWRAEEYAVDLNEGWGQAVKRIESVQQSRCHADVRADRVQNLNVVNQFGSEKFKHILLPIWIASYRYNDKTFRFLINGQNGQVQGEAPYSWFKIIAFVMFIVLVIATIYMILQS